MSLKIVVTGKNDQIADDLRKHLERDRGYEVLSCMPIRKNLLKLTLAELPQVVVICMRNDTPNETRIYNSLRECAEIGLTWFLVVANEEDRKTFQRNTNLEHVLFLSRPVSLQALYYKLIDIEKEWEEFREELRSKITEFENPIEIEDTGKKRVLVVDDDADQLILMKEHLRAFFDVKLLGSGRMVFPYLRRYRADLILLDYLMPDMNGPEVLARLRAQPMTRDIPVVFLTGVSDRETVMETIERYKPQGYVLKPVEKLELIGKIVEVLS